ncbi:MAG: 4-hydroxythreonine-4-phosphate dehydrogenase PdxA [Oligoflexia bacterium]|nr:4-hydroxythreonine-4-phosphate dehydrogenase PdxA [Oligoflexia bacterium]
MDRREKESIFYKTKFPLKNRIALTTGDPKGVGYFITKKALKKLGPKKNFQFLIWTHQQADTLRIPPFKTSLFTNSDQALKSPFKERSLLQIKSKKDSGAWLLDASQKALNQKVSALVTGPVNKSQLKKYKSVGQTDLLKKQTQVNDIFMCFRGRFFNVILLSDHIPFKKIAINKQKLSKLLKLALLSRKILPASLQKKPLGLLALNPHAGENGLLGVEEKRILKPFLKKWKEVEGPLCPDSAFLEKTWNKYSFFIALYHDQGLIPFKMIHNHKGFAQSLGLPFLRLGVDHGTGLGLKNKEISHESFLSALKESLRLIRLYQK